eukprot:m.47202 g.47202  ORF g.47202 m.47202 type:complete len:343 (+) comp17618_c0_seq1:91-1119(+)
MAEELRKRTAGSTSKTKSKSEKSQTRKSSSSHRSRPKSRALTCYHRFLIFTVVYISLILALMYIPTMQRFFIYMHHFQMPFTNLSRPHDFNLDHTSNIMISIDDKIALKGWHVAPPESAPSDGKPVIIYFHGNMGTRGVQHRCKLYDFLRDNFDAHVITFDYRGFGDSPGEPTEESMKEDAKLIWDFALDYAEVDNIHLWGHSLGTGIATFLAHELSLEGTPPGSLILEAPFTSLADAAKTYPLSIPFRVKFLLDLVDKFIVDDFPSKDIIHNVACDILIVHGTSDWIIPSSHGEQLAKHAKSDHPDKDVVLELIHGAGHKNIHTFEEKLSSTLQKFWGFTD